MTTYVMRRDAISATQIGPDLQAFAAAFNSNSSGGFLPLAVAVDDGIVFVSEGGKRIRAAAGWWIISRRGASPEPYHGFEAVISNREFRECYVPVELPILIQMRAPERAPSTPSHIRSHVIVTGDGPGHELEFSPGGTVLVTEEVAAKLRHSGFTDAA
jgi:hypothetical protein